MPPDPSCRRVAPLVLVYPAGAPPPRAPERGLALPQLPGAAFGDGTHPTTRLCAGALDLLARERRPAAVLDVGTGTGILARIARARGAAFVAATDVDPGALQAAAANAALDPCPGVIEVARRPPDAWGRRFELAVANILEPVLVDLAPAIARALVAGGALLLSGVTPAQAPALRLAYARAAFEPVTQAALDGWALLELRAP